MSEYRWEKVRIWPWFGRYSVILPYGNELQLKPNDLQLVPDLDVTAFRDRIMLVGWQLTPEAVYDAWRDDVTLYTYVDVPEEGRCVAVRTTSHYVMVDVMDLQDPHQASLRA